MGWRATISPTPLASAASIRTSTVLVHWRADRVEIDFVGTVDGVSAERFGLAVNLVQRDAERAEEAERVGAERGPAGRCRAQPREPEPVAQRAEQDQVGERRAAAAPKRRKSELHAELIEAALERRRNP